ncbi:Protein indeterminate-domain 5, chloroplastic [Vitis vinifera]|uniref:Protein indeterminate-domain 5, chloroplastic n=1 Tax=Vitis vinifera TaxID=29760 RepID=A0A438JRF8_VITVI|nr:Protein indeterminate-domain 5, chloroplastic [Vitis vinifera]
MCDPDAEVIALSPKTLMATNRFICEVCNKGFQREQNLQLHRRGHNLPWKLKQKTTKEVRRKVYLCPEPGCVHHDPARALATSLIGKPIPRPVARENTDVIVVPSSQGTPFHDNVKGNQPNTSCLSNHMSLFEDASQFWSCAVAVHRSIANNSHTGTPDGRDSFITHRAFCDALAQESARHPTPMSTIGSHLYGSSNMGLGLSQVGPQISSMPDQSHQPGDMLRLGGARAGQFDHLIPPAIGSSSFRTPQPMPSQAFYIPEPNQEFHEDQQSQHGGLLTNKPFHGLVHLPDLQNNTNNPSSAANLFNLSFFSNSSNTNSMLSNTNNANNSTNMPSSGLLISDQFNTVNGGSGSERNNLFPSNIIGDQISSGVPSLFSTSLQNENAVSHMSATALLQKAAQMGSTSSNNSASLLRGFAGSSSANAKSDRPLVGPNFGGVFGENESHLQDLMNSLGGGSSSIFGGGSGGVNAYSGHENENTYGGFNANRSTLEQQQQQQQQHRHGPNFCNIDEIKLHQNLTANMGGSDRLTRDFLGVGQMVRTISGGFSQRDLPPPGINISTLDSERSSAQTSQAFGGGNFQ